MDPTIILLIVLVAVMGFFMFRSSRKRQQEAAKLLDQLVPGAQVMTQHGIYGTLISLDRDKNEAVIESMPGTKLRLHVQTLTRVVEPDLPEIATAENATAEIATAEIATEGEQARDDRRATVLNGEPLPEAEPRYGERIPKPRGRRKPPAEEASE